MRLLPRWVVTAEVRNAERTADLHEGGLFAALNAARLPLARWDFRRVQRLALVDARLERRPRRHELALPTSTADHERAI
jgi:hypothetical protein